MAGWFSPSGGYCFESVPEGTGGGGGGPGACPTATTNGDDPTALGGARRKSRSPAPLAGAAGDEIRSSATNPPGTHWQDLSHPAAAKRPDFAKKELVFEEKAAKLAQTPAPSGGKIAQAERTMGTHQSRLCEQLTSLTDLLAWQSQLEKEKIGPTPTHPRMWKRAWMRASLPVRT